MNKRNLQDALNRMDELANQSGEKTTEEMEQLAQDYSLLMNYIEESQVESITVPLSENDCHDIIRGVKFDWTFEGVDVHLELEE